MTDPALGTSRMISKIKLSALPRVQQFAPFLQASSPAQSQPVQPIIPVVPAQPVAPPIVSDPVLDQAPTPDAVVEPQVDETTAMDTFDEVMQSMSQAVPTVVQQVTDPLNPQVVYGGSTAKEAFDRASADQEVSELGGLQQVEFEQSPELSPEISDYIQKVESQIESQPQEIVINAQGDSQMQPVMLPQPVVVLPITPEIEQQGEKLSTAWSVRWLVEWSRKLMKMLSGHIIYKQT